MGRKSIYYNPRGLASKRCVANKCGLKKAIGLPREKYMHICLVFYGNALIAQVVNDSFAHAEMHGLTKLIFHLEKKGISSKRHMRKRATMIVYRYNPKTGRATNSEPCNQCCKTINKYSHLFDRIIWSTQDEHFISSSPILHNEHITRGNRPILGIY